MLKVVLAATVLLVGLLALPTAAEAATPGVCPADAGVTVAYSPLYTGSFLQDYPTIGGGYGGTPPGTTDSYYCTYVIHYKSDYDSQPQSVRVYWGFDYGYHTTGNLRAFVYMTPAATNSANIHLQVDPLNLGTNNGVLTQSSLNVQSGTLFAETPPVNPCHTQTGAVYLANAHVSMRFDDGTVMSANPQFAGNGSAICS
ncbi:hypothetical protein [Jatrophihabitans sp. GAS493]|uniref:hypothetical protein n=1 Tax=Jatrophihabitans sp. GAS493 TaxID=1907575 RepID=UPI0012FD7616|nr:hypothetical protein [Jatrophihabitans sp. GAS493]